MIKAKTKILHKLITIQHSVVGASRHRDFTYLHDDEDKKVNQNE